MHAEKLCCALQRQDALLPLTPALSPGERVNHSPRDASTEPARIFPTRKELFPLPWGEGQGEGEDDVLLDWLAQRK
ncbi:MAG: hypothetical protein DME21_10410 [Verrucomicrobia bacterium]|nr:MAG: hypothetical protein DME21_10410 [Verrucomicrobiota bacterium]